MKIVQGQGQGQSQDFFLKAKAKDIKFFQGQYQGQLSQLPLWAKICITVTATEYAYLIIHNAKETICDSVDVQYLTPKPPQIVSFALYFIK